MADVEVQVRFSESEAWDLAQFLKRVGFDQFFVNAQDNDGGYCMMFAAERSEGAGRSRLFTQVIGGANRGASMWLWEV